MKVRALKTVNNPHVVLRLASAKVWPKRLPPPIFASDNDALIRAVSLVHNLPTRDAEPVRASDMTPAQARDVVRHFSATPANTADPSPLGQGVAGVASSSESAS